jgi:cyclin-dependent kinase regulatory subunit CKS1
MWREEFQVVECSCWMWERKLFHYSEKHEDDIYEYRHVIVPTKKIIELKQNHLMTEKEWRGFGVEQSKGWEHYMWHRPSRDVLLFRRLLIKPKHDDINPQPHHGRQRDGRGG